MKRAALACLFVWLLCGAESPWSLIAQEAGSGIDLRATLTGQLAGAPELTDAPRSGAPVAAGFRSVVYPTWKMNGNWFVTGAMQLETSPYLYSDFSSTGYHAKGNLLQANLNYSRVSDKGALLLRAGVLPTAFGSFLLRYDDADNSLIDMPPGYGYYYALVSTLGVSGAQIDATRGRWDVRAQFANSSPANPRSLFARDQYGNWAGGAGFTIRQGFRVGASAFYGPYLDRHDKFFFPGEAKPSKLRARAEGIDANWAHGHTTILGEVQWFRMPYTVIPVYRETSGYSEMKQVLTPRWYAACRIGATSASFGGQNQTIEVAAGFRPNRFQIVKVGYEFDHYGATGHDDDQIAAIQIVTTLHASASRN